MGINLTEENISNVINRIKDSWVYLLSVYCSIQITVGDAKEEINKYDNQNGEDFETVNFPIDFQGEEFGTAQFGYIKETQFDYSDFISNIPLALKRRRNLSYAGLIPDGLVFIAKTGEIKWMNSIANEMLNRLETDLMRLLQKIFAIGENPWRLDDMKVIPGIKVAEINLDKFDILGISIPIFSDNQVLGFFIIISDSTFIHQKDRELILKAAFVKEIHHRVKNNLQTIASLLSLQMRRTNSGKIEKAFLESINRISSIAIIHDELSKEGPESVNLKTAVNNIFNIILTNMVSKAKDIKGEIICGDVYVNANVASTLSLCVTELIQNAVEHAFVFRNKGAIIITIEENEGMISIIVQDDGIGFNPHKSKPSLGLEIISMITEDTLKGNFYIEAHTYGTISKIVFPRESIE